MRTIGMTALALLGGALLVACFPRDDGIDTLTQVLTLVQYPQYRAPVYGKFLGSNVDAPATPSPFACCVARTRIIPAAPPPTTSCGT